MHKIFPHSEGLSIAVQNNSDGQLRDQSPTILTVWKKSLVFNCDGIHVFDSNGSLVFRVDNYGSYLKGEAVLMDGQGNPLLTMRRKTVSLQDRWEGFRGDVFDPRKPIFTMRRSSFLQMKAMADVFMSSSKGEKHSDYQIEGSYCKRSCTIYHNSSRSVVAEVKRKQATSEIMLGDDVFSLVVQPSFSPTFIMGLVVILDRMGRKPICYKCQ